MICCTCRGYEIKRFGLFKHPKIKEKAWNFPLFVSFTLAVFKILNRQVAGTASRRRILFEKLLVSNTDFVTIVALL